jgi:hypothetical protein
MLLLFVALGSKWQSACRGFRWKSYVCGFWGVRIQSLHSRLYRSQGWWNGCSISKFYLWLLCIKVGKLTSIFIHLGCGQVFWCGWLGPFSRRVGAWRKDRVESRPLPSLDAQRNQGTIFLIYSKNFQEAIILTLCVCVSRSSQKPSVAHWGMAVDSMTLER